MAGSWLATPGRTRAVLEDHGLYTKKRFGQNFLVNDSVIEWILDLAQLGSWDGVPAEKDVALEVGPGIGTLTVALLEHAAACVSIEADRTLVPVLHETCARDSERFALIQADALKVGPDDVADALRGLRIDGLPTEPAAFVANLPYQVAATLILRYLQQMPSLRRAVVMVQAEVADRISATPGTKAYGAYTAKLALVGRVTGRFEVGPHNFMPPPHVDSAVVRIERAPVEHPRTGELLSPEALEGCARVIDAAFTQRRKTIRNSMKSSGYDADALDAAFEACGIAPTVRAEMLDAPTFVRLACELGEA